MIAELGATSAVFPPDDNTREWLKRQQREDDFEEMGPDDSADYDDRVEIDLSELGPLIAKPHSPGNVVPVEEVAGTEIAQVCLGSSVNSGYYDLALPGAILADEGGQYVHPEVAATATPGSRQILSAIAESGVYRQLSEGGVRMLEPVCGPCVGMGQAPPSDANSLRTFNRNFPGRSGTPEDSVFLCSPAVAAVSLLHGKIADPREYGDPPEMLDPPTRTRPSRSRSLAGRTSSSRPSTCRSTSPSRSAWPPSSPTTSPRGTWHRTASRSWPIARTSRPSPSSPSAIATRTSASA
jgi:aconitate hydratase